MATTTFDDVLTFIRTSASADDLDRFEDTRRQRTRTLNDARAQAITLEQPVRLDRYQDARLNGLTGTVEHIEQTRGKTTYVAVRLDEASTDRYRNVGHVPEGVTQHIVKKLHASGCYPA
ncbi:hypothetical protein AB0F20_29800 [Streptomyces goshikiensis]|uniref:hypothetical protein n=1 Tax=Streptomyces goshikiensis TaxID=1942 RepID=UPI0033D69F57